MQYLLSASSRNNSLMESESMAEKEAYTAQILSNSAGTCAAHAAKVVRPTDMVKDTGVGVTDTTPYYSTAAAYQMSSSSPHPMDCAYAEMPSPRYISSLRNSVSVQSETASAARAPQRGRPADAESMAEATG